MHLALRTHHRTLIQDRELFNITHDFIINEYLKESFGLTETPADGLDWQTEFGRYYDIKDKPAEELMKFIKDSFGKELDRKRIYRLVCDVFSDELELKLFPGLSIQDLTARKADINSRSFKAISTKLIIDKADLIFGKGTTTGDNSSTYDMIRSLYKPPWEAALQSWIDFAIRTGHTYSRPSRRGQSADYVLPGYKREGHTLHILVDTSGSMSGALGIVLGVIASFCDDLQVENIHIIQCDAGVSDDNWFTPDQLNRFKVKGLGGSDMSPGMYRLQNDPEVQYALIITDGYIDYPTISMPYQVLWVLTEQNCSFKPDYGQIISLPALK